MPLDALPGAHRLAHHREARVAQRELLAPSQDKYIRCHEHGEGECQPQQLGPHERHRISSRCLGMVPPAASRLRRLRMSAKRRIASTRLSSVESSSASMPASRNAPRSSFSRRSAAATKRLRKDLSWVSTKICSPVSARSEEHTSELQS